jgi:CRP/FNR family cyclic AMP-dependent transcriptional regulator
MNPAGAAGTHDKPLRSVGRAREWPPHSYLGLLSQPVREALLALGVKRVFSPGQVFITQGDTARDMFAIVKGLAKVTITGPVGPQLVDVQAQGDTVGELAAIDGQPRSATVAAIGRVEAVEIRSDDLVAFFEATPAAAIAMNRMMSLRQRRKVDQILNFSQFDVGARLARTLVALGEKCGTSEAEGLVLDSLISQPELAALVGVSEPTIHKALRSLRESGALMTGYRRMVIVDLDRLQQIGHIHEETLSSDLSDQIILQDSSCQCRAFTSSL